MLPSVRGDTPISQIIARLTISCVGGQSAGAGSVRALLQSPPAKGLFQGAILESDPTPPTYSHYLTIDQEVDSQTTSILNLTGCTNTNANAAVACLRRQNASDLVALKTVAGNVVVDGTYVVEPAIFFNHTSYVADVPLLIGNMRVSSARHDNCREASAKVLSRTRPPLSASGHTPRTSPRSSQSTASLPHRLRTTLQSSHCRHLPPQT
jgi:carboxylesterase type B